MTLQLLLWLLLLRLVPILMIILVEGVEVELVELALVDELVVITARVHFHHLLSELSIIWAI